MTQQEFFAALDLTLPGLEAVQESVSRADWPSACTAFAAYLRSRKTPRWHFDWRSPLANAEPVTPKEIQEARDALQNRFTVIDITHEFAGEIDWTYNPTTQPGSPYAANNEWTWQFNRHRYWVPMGRVYHALDDEAYAQAFVRQMLHWVQSNPVPAELQQGPSSRWRTIEAGIRMGQTWPNAFFYFLSSPHFTAEAIVTMVASMVEHARYLSNPQTGGNWLTMEMNGLYHVGALFPEFKEAKQWREFAARCLREELDRQVYPDGAQFELTPWYHNVALKNFLGIVKVAEINGYELPDGYLERLEAMFDFDLYMMTPSCGLPTFNDSAPLQVTRALQEGYRLFPNREDFQWAATNRAAGKAPQRTSHAFPYAGYVIQRSGWDADARYLAFDVGPFGYGHQHEDKLNFVLSAYGRDFVVEAGTYSYDRSKWRSYVLSPYAHNVAFVDGRGQNRRARRETYVITEPVDFVWQQMPEYEFAQGSYGSELEGYGDESAWIATHQRSVLFVKEGTDKDFWVVADTFVPRDNEAHLYETLFHLDAPGVTIDTSIPAVRTGHAAGANLGIFALQTDGFRLPQAVMGQEEPFVLGWMRAGSHAVKPIPTVTFGVQGAGVRHLLYVFYPVRDSVVPEVTLSPWQPDEAEQGGVGAEIRFADGRLYRVSIPQRDRDGEKAHSEASPVILERELA